jgi:hypothetical protein
MQHLLKRLHTSRESQKVPKRMRSHIPYQVPRNLAQDLSFMPELLEMLFRASIHESEYLRNLWRPLWGRKVFYFQRGRIWVPLWLQQDLTVLWQQRIVHDWVPVGVWFKAVLKEPFRENGTHPLNTIYGGTKDDKEQEGWSAVIIDLFPGNGHRDGQLQ